MSKKVVYALRFDTSNPNVEAVFRVYSSILRKLYKTEGEGRSIAVYYPVIDRGGVARKVRVVLRLDGELSITYDSGLLDRVQEEAMRNEFNTLLYLSVVVAAMRKLGYKRVKISRHGSQFLAFGLPRSRPNRLSHVVATADGNMVNIDYRFFPDSTCDSEDDRMTAELSVIGVDARRVVEKYKTGHTRVEAEARGEPSHGGPVE